MVGGRITSMTLKNGELVKLKPGGQVGMRKMPPEVARVMESILGLTVGGEGQFEFFLSGAVF